MKIIICDVGNAASAFVVANNGYTMMIDCGSSSEKENPIDVFNWLKEWAKSVPYITQYGHEYPIALLHITHPDDDHVRNAEEVKKRLEPYLLKRNRYEEFPDGKAVNSEYVEKVDKVYRGNNPEKIEWGFDFNEECSIPVSTCINTPSLKNKVRNNSSIIRYIKQDGVGILFCGDLEKAGWEKLIEDNLRFISLLRQERVNILVAPHHGHKSGFPKALFDAIGNVDFTILSKDTEANIDGTDVSSQYSNYSDGVTYFPLNDNVYKYYGKVLTTRSNGHIIIDTDIDGGYLVCTQTASSNHTKTIR